MMSTLSVKAPTVSAFQACPAPSRSSHLAYPVKNPASIFEGATAFCDKLKYLDRLAGFNSATTRVVLGENADDSRD